MSAEAVGWVYRYSPAKGAALLVHLAIADSANDQHRYEVWMRQHVIATKARLSVRAVGDALAWLTENGLLDLIEEGKAAGKSNRYRLLMPEGLAVMYDPQRGYAQSADPPEGGTHEVQTGYARRADRGTNDVQTGYARGADITQKRTQGVEPKGEPNNARATPGRAMQLALVASPGFDEFWAVYPRKVAKGQAQRAWKAAIKRAAPSVVVEGARRYAEDPTRSDEFTAHAATWLNGDRWADEGPVRPRSTRGTAAGVAAAAQEWLGRQA